MKEQCCIFDGNVLSLCLFFFTNLWICELGYLQMKESDLFWYSVIESSYGHVCYVDAFNQFDKRKKMMSRCFVCCLIFCLCNNSQQLWWMKVDAAHESHRWTAKANLGLFIDSYPKNCCKWNLYLFNVMKICYKSESMIYLYPCFLMYLF